MMSRKLILISCGVIKTIEHDFAVVLCSIRRSSFRNHQFIQVCDSFDFLRRKLRKKEGGSFFGSEIDGSRVSRRGAGDDIEGQRLVNTHRIGRQK